MGMFTRVKDRVGVAMSPRVVQPSEDSAGRSWESSSAVISASAMTRECERVNAAFGRNRGASSCNRIYLEKIRNCLRGLSQHWRNYVPGETEAGSE